MTKVRFDDTVADEWLAFAVIVSRFRGQHVFCKHKDRDTWEIPGGHREAGESIMEAARRELYEETGAVEYTLQPVCVYAVTAPEGADSRESFGMLFFADIRRFESALHYEIESIALMDQPPFKWTYPDIQPHLLEEAEKRGYFQTMQSTGYA